MTIEELIKAIEALGLDPNTEVVLSNSTEGSFSDFELEVCDHEHEGGDVIKGSDPGGWGGPDHDPRPLPTPVLSLHTHCSSPRKAITF
ncbi:MAG: hypothetical protein ACK42D_03655 [Candidatus Paceibacteria bacterium]